jgi:hypothetical protein
MTASSVDTAELPRVAAVPVVTPPVSILGAAAVVNLPVLDFPPVVDPATVPVESLATVPVESLATVPVDAPAPLDRLALRAERRQQRRQRRLYVGLGLSVLASTLAATIVVLDVVR